MLFIIFDPGFLLFIILFFVLGAIGMFMEIATVLFSILLTVVVLLGLLAYLLYKYGSKGLMAWLVGLVIIVAGLLVMDHIGNTPHGKYNSAKASSCIVLRAGKRFETDRKAFEEKDIIVLSWLDQKKGLTDVHVYSENGCTSFGQGGSIATVSNQFIKKGAEQLVITDEAVWEGVMHKFDNTRNIMQLSDEEIVELVNQTSNELDERKKEGKEDELKRYYEEIIGKKYEDFDTPGAFFPGETMDGVRIWIRNRNIIRYQSGTFRMVKRNNDIYWEPINISLDKEYEYYLKRGFFGKIYIIINNGQYKYTFETDSAYNILRLNVYD